jgi:hypothetical protein
MVWPYDIQDYVAAPDLPIPSATFNDLQTAVNEIMGGVGGTFTLVITRAISEYFDEGDALIPAWQVNNANPEHGYECLSAGYDLWIPIPGRVGCRITQVQAKVYGTAATGIQLSLYPVDVNFASSTTAPVLGSISGGPAAFAGTPPAWETLTISSIAWEHSADVQNFALIDTHNTGDKFAGLEVTYDRYLTSGI